MESPRPTVERSSGPSAEAGCAEPAGAGKSTAGALLARRLGWDYVTTGMFYRGVAALA
ncbi:MAG: (d)CMP kinase, partial [Verrucomicrobiota bacterium]